LRRNGRFKLAVAGKRVSLNLVRPNGTYYGPVVLDRGKRGRAHLTLKRSAKLGTVQLKGSYARVARPVKKKLLASSWLRVNRKGKPAGAGRLGARVASRSLKARSAQLPPPQNAPELGADGDHDGLTNAYDVDDDNDAVLDASDTDQGPQQNLPGRAFTNLWAELPDTLNANLGEVSGAAIDALLTKNLSAAFDANPGLGLPGVTVEAVNVDCFKISWCAPRTGTATIPEFAYGPNGAGAGQPAPGSRWVDFDPDGDGLPNLAPDPRRIEAGGYGVQLTPAVGRAGLDPAATMNFRFTTDKGVTEYATTFGPSFVTVPAIVKLDGQTIHYPAASSGDFVVSSPKVSVTLYRPQRLAIAGAEQPGYYDMGHLRYEVGSPQSGTGEPCPASAFSHLDPTLTTVSNGPDQGVLDSADDAPASPANTISFTVDLSQCAGGVPSGRGFPFNVIARTARGENAGTRLTARVG
jgi:hypothetical protein